MFSSNFYLYFISGNSRLNNVCLSIKYYVVECTYELLNIKLLEAQYHFAVNSYSVFEDIKSFTTPFFNMQTYCFFQSIFPFYFTFTCILEHVSDVY